MEKVIRKIKRFFGVGKIYDELEFELIDAFEDRWVYTRYTIQERIEQVFKDLDFVDDAFIEVRLMNVFSDDRITFYAKEDVHEKIKRFFDIISYED